MRVVPIASSARLVRASSGRMARAHPDQIEAIFEQTEPGCALASIRLSHFLRRTGAHFGGKCFRAALSGALLLAGVPAGHAEQKLPPTATKWSLQDNFGKNVEARTNLSGAACARTAPPFASCLIANDEKKYAQFFSLDGNTVAPGKLIRLVDQDANGDPDAEGVAYSDGHFYVVGSHGRSRHGNKPNDSSYVVFRFPVDKTTGKPTFAVSEDQVTGIESSTRLRQALMTDEAIKSFYDKPLAENGINIEGIAVKGGRMHLGLRGPSQAGHAFVLSVDAAATFTTDRSLDAAVRSLMLGESAGIRDLAAVDDGVLVLSGPVNEQPVAPAVFLWDDRSGALKKLAELQRPEDVQETAKAEILLVLNDAPGQPWRILVMFDGPENGAPTEYLIPR